MASAGQLKEAVNNVANQSRQFQEMLSKFETTNQQHLERATSALQGTESGTDHKVETAMDEALQAIRSAKQALGEAAQAASAYAARL